MVREMFSQAYIAAAHALTDVAQDANVIWIFVSDKLDLLAILAI